MSENDLYSDLCGHYENLGVEQDKKNQKINEYKQAIQFKLEGGRFEKGLRSKKTALENKVTLTNDDRKQLSVI